jgi:hypothetical protein
MRLLLIAFGCLAAVGAVLAQTPVTPGAPMQPPIAVQNDLAMQDYLFLLQQIAPAARDGAEAYLQAFALRCGRRLNVDELRRRVADGSGEPVLMQMIRAAHVRDEKRIAQLGTSIRCEAGG